jgi:squalene-hopene/tetraprenyl-beta-curcumene cyclase
VLRKMMLTGAIFFCALPGLTRLSAATDEMKSWSSKDAAAYLDGRAVWWMGWKQSQRDHDTFCISCHTALPYALGRPALRTALGEHALSENERLLVENVTKRVKLWQEVLPFYNDEKNGAPKTSEARGTEAVLNALILVSYDAHEGKLSDTTKLALNNMWALQMKTGESKGAFMWLNFHNEPWEADDATYWGAALAAIAVGQTPKAYQSSPEIQENTKLLAEYLRQHQEEQSMVNRLFVLWASTKLPGIMNAEQQKSFVDGVLSRQQDDGGWSTTSITVPTWRRRDWTPLETKSDGYATGLAAFVLQRAGVSRTQPQMSKALSWLAHHQDQAAGLWPATSMNKQRDPASDAGKFMSDAATAFSVMALNPGN